MDGFGFHLDYWAWLILAGALIVIEILAPSSFFLWLGIAAAIMGGVSFLIPTLIWPVQVVLFAILSVFAVAIGRRYFKPQATESDHPLLNRRGNQYIGRQFTLEAPIVNGVGWLRVGDSRWRVQGPDLPTGTQVIITGVEGATLIVDQVSAAQST